MFSLPASIRSSRRSPRTLLPMATSGERVFTAVVQMWSNTSLGRVPLGNGCGTIFDAVEQRPAATVMRADRKRSEHTLSGGVSRQRDLAENRMQELQVGSVLRLPDRYGWRIALQLKSAHSSHARDASRVPLIRPDLVRRNCPFFLIGYRVAFGIAFLLSHFCAALTAKQKCACFDHEKISVLGCLWRLHLQSCGSSGRCVLPPS
jgi:hypothetical protein